jgi:RNA polymerase sigma factor (sigma-70 family)
MAELSDEEILTLFHTGENRHYAFNLLVRKYQEKLYFAARRLVIDHDDADDVIQNVFLKVWTHLDSFREDSKLFTWMYRITINESLSFLKNKNLRSYLSFNSPEAQMLQTLKADNYFTGTEIQRKLQEAIIKLPKKQRLVFNMRYFDEMSYEKMSEVLGTSVGALKASFHIASKKIEEYVTSN